ncbi:MAG TPA: hypothetical protein VK957_04940 [Lunatimonas sp.]|nr:hypothetical protein [Lunatimonas sp.]
MKSFILYSFIVSGLWLTSCQTDQALNEADPSLILGEDVVYMQLDLDPIGLNSINPMGRIQHESGYSLILHKAEYITAPGSAQKGITVIFSDRGNKQLADDFSPFASLDGSSDISYYLDQTRPSSSISLSRTESALQRVVNTWENVQCSDLGLNRVPNSPTSIGIVAAIFGFPGEIAYVADVVHAGWMPGSFFEILAPGGSGFILGVTFTFLLIDGEGNLLDTNQDGKWDVALREIYYNDNFSWSDDGTAIDVETVALHEMGHGLSQAHFGKAFIKKKGGIQFAPRAVMNAAYSGIQTRISGTDLGGHCSNWANWPNK